MKNKPNIATTKKDFMLRLHTALHEYGVDFDNDIYTDFEQHFEYGIAQGLSEQEVCQKLGDIDEIALSYLPEGSESVKKQTQEKNENNKNNQTFTTDSSGFSSASDNNNYNNNYNNAQYTTSQAQAASQKSEKNISGLVLLIIADILFLFWIIFALGCVVFGVSMVPVGVLIGAVLSLGALFLATTPIFALLLLSSSILLIGLTIIFSVCAIYLIKGYVWIWKQYVNVHVKLAGGTAI